MNLAFRLAQGGVRKDLPPSLAVNPLLETWIAFGVDGTISIRSGKVEIGQGILTALAQIAAEELCVDVERIRMVPAQTGLSPDEAVTSGSLSVQESGVAIRLVCAEARERLLARAAERWNTDVGALEAVAGEVRHAPSGRAAPYASLDPHEVVRGEVSGRATPRPIDRHRVVGRSVPRTDLAAKASGGAVYIHDLALPGMRYGRVIRPAKPGARLASIDAAALADLPQVRLVRDGGFLGVVAEREYLVELAAERCRRLAVWEDAPLPFAGEALHDWIRRQRVETTSLENRGAPDAPQGDRTVDLRYTKPYIAHASIGPSCAVAWWRDDALEVWSHSQGIYNLRADLAIAVRLPVERIVVHHAAGAGCYGHNGADDAALDAVLLARALPGTPIQVVWSRQDELTRSPMGPAMAIDIRATLDPDGRVVAWRHQTWSNGHSLRPGRADTPTLLAAGEIADGFAPRIAVNAALAAGGGSERNAIPFYDFETVEVLNHRLLTMPVRTSALRSLGALGNVFAIESAMDELAALAECDPVEFRLRQLPDPRARRVLETAARAADWTARAQLPESVGRGVGVAHYKNTGAYCAVVVDVDAREDVRVTRVVAAVDVGLVINPDGVENQIEGGIVQAMSWALLEQVVFSGSEVTSVDWESYPIARFSSVPRIEVHQVAAADAPPVGAGEAAQGPTVAAIANAIHHALGVRVRDLPMTRERIISAIG